MSAYALPGLFPPIDPMSQSSSNGIKTIADSSGSSEESLSDRKIPLHLQQDHGEQYSGNRDNRIGCILNSAAIAVKEAKIDPVRWIEYVTGRRRVSNSNHSSSGQANRALFDSTSGSKPKSSYGNGGSSCNSKNKSQQNEAIEFELSITFKGRRYTAKRTMQCMMQLRDDLIREMNRRRQWLTEKQDLGSLRFTQPSCFDSTHSSRNKVTTKPEQDNHAAQIPEIPPFTDDRHHSGDPGFVGKGFMMLHAMVKSYVPVMESWLKSVMEVVPQDSECFMNFLWEPTTEAPSACFKSVLDSVNNNNDQTICVSNKLKSSMRLATLGSIKEMDCDSGDDNSEVSSDEFAAGGWKE